MRAEMIIDDTLPAFAFNDEDALANQPDRSALPVGSNATDLFPTDTSVLLLRAFTQMACLHTIASTTANYGFRSVKAVTM
jgi:hypothetical protein